MLCDPRSADEGRSSFQFHRFINRGFLTGPWLPIYGSGAVLITAVIKGLVPLEFSVGTTFAVSFLLCGLLYREEDASPEIRELKREVESKKAVLQKRRALFPKL